LNNYNGTPKGHLNRDLRATLPINQLKGKPLVAVCSILNVHRCKLRNGVKWEMRFAFYTFAHSKRPLCGQLRVSEVILIAHYKCAMV
jgi:hypothetical protein